MENHEDGTTVWDNYNQPRKHTAHVADKYYTETWKSNAIVKPIQTETLKQYAIRLDRVLIQMEETAAQHLHGKQGLPWYTHRSAGPCFICDNIAIAHIIHDTLWDLSQIDPKRYTFDTPSETSRTGLRKAKR